MGEERWVEKQYSTFTCETCYNENNQVHKLDGPAVIYYKRDENGKKIIKKELWYKEDLQHREGNKPAVKEYNEWGEISKVAYFKNGKRHRENGAAVVSFFSNGKISTLSYYRNNILDNIDKPSMIEFDPRGNIRAKGYYLRNQLHRENGPALIFYKNNKVVEDSYYKNGVIHRVEGPANIMYNLLGHIRDYYYAINGTFIDAKEYNNIVDRIQNSSIRKSINKYGIKKFHIVYEMVKYYGTQDLIDLFENRLMIEKLKS